MAKRISNIDIKSIWERLNAKWLEHKKEVIEIPTSFVSETIIVGTNRVTLFNRGQEVYEIMKELFRNAETEILIDSFIFAGDELGQEIQEILLKKEEGGGY